MTGLEQESKAVPATKRVGTCATLQSRGEGTELGAQNTLPGHDPHQWPIKRTSLKEWLEEDR